MEALASSIHLYLTQTVTAYDTKLRLQIKGENKIC